MKCHIFAWYRILSYTYYKYNNWENAPPPPLKKNNSSDWQTWQIRVDIHHLSLGKEDLNPGLLVMHCPPS